MGALNYHYIIIVNIIFFPIQLLFEFQLDNTFLNHFVLHVRQIFFNTTF